MTDGIGSDVEHVRAHGVPLFAWLSVCRALRVWHRYEVDGLHHLDGLGAALLVAYHGRPVAYDLGMLSVTLHERLGYMPRGIIHDGFEKIAPLRWFSRGMGFVARDGPGLADAVARGELILVEPGGTREGCRSFRHRYSVDWGDRVGYLRLALRYRLPIVPIAASGIDDGYIGLNDGYALGRRFPALQGVPLWVGIGPLGIWPLSPPFPVKIRQIIGAPIDVAGRGLGADDDKSLLLPLHREIAGAVQALLDHAQNVAANDAP